MKVLNLFVLQSPINAPRPLAPDSPEIIIGSPDTGQANVFIASSDSLSEIDIDPIRLFFNISQARVDTDLHHYLLEPTQPYMALHNH